MDEAIFQKIVDGAMASVPPSATSGYDEALALFTDLRAQLVAAGATDADIVSWLHDCLAPPFVEASERAQVAEEMRALCDAFGYQMMVDDVQKTVTLRRRPAQK